MSRIGQRPVPVPQDVTVEVSGQEMTARGPMGELSISFGASPKDFRWSWKL